MRLYVGAALLVVVVLGAAWLVLALGFGHSLGNGTDAYTRSVACVRRDRSLVDDRAAAGRFRSSGLQPLAIRWDDVRAVALFSNSLSPDSVDRADTRITTGLRRRGLSAAEIAGRLLHQDNLSLYYLTGAPSRAAES